MIFFSFSGGSSLSSLTRMTIPVVTLLAKGTVTRMPAHTSSPQR